MNNTYTPTEIAKAYAGYFGIPKEDYYPLRQEIVNTITRFNLGVRKAEGNKPRLNKFTAGDIAITLFAREHKDNIARIIINLHNDREPNLSVFRLEEIIIDQNHPWEGWQLEIAKYGVLPEGIENPNPLWTGINIGPRHLNDQPLNAHLPIISIYVGLWWLPEFWACLEVQDK